jgi:hypothetical protein
MWEWTRRQTGTRTGEHRAARGADRKTKKAARRGPGAAGERNDGAGRSGPRVRAYPGRCAFVMGQPWAAEAGMPLPLAALLSGVDTLERSHVTARAAVRAFTASRGWMHGPWNYELG